MPTKTGWRGSLLLSHHVTTNASYKCVLSCTLNGECRAEYAVPRPTQRATTDTLAAILSSAKKPLCINDRPLLTDLVYTWLTIAVDVLRHFSTRAAWLAKAFVHEYITCMLRIYEINQKIVGRVWSRSKDVGKFFEIQICIMYFYFYLFLFLFIIYISQKSLKYLNNRSFVASISKFSGTISNVYCILNTTAHKRDENI